MEKESIALLGASDCSIMSSEARLPGRGERKCGGALPGTELRLAALELLESAIAARRASLPSPGSRRRRWTEEIH